MLLSHLPLGKKPLTLTTTLTFPPPLSGVFRLIGTISDSLERSDGVDAEDLSGRASAATPGNARGSSAMAFKPTAMVSMRSRKRRRCEMNIQE